MATTMISSPQSILPNRYQSLASQYPLTTIASLGAVAGLTFASTAYLTSRLAGRLFRARSANQLSRSSASHSGSVATTATDFTQRMGEGRMRAIAKDISDDLEKRLVGVLRQDIRSALDDTIYMSAKGAKGGADAVAGLAEKLGSVEDQIVASNRDRRMELQGFRNEIMGHLTMLEGQGKAAGGSDDKFRLIEDLISAANKDRRAELQGSRNEMMGRLSALEDAVKAGGSGEKLGMIEDQIVAANRDRRSELQWFRNEIMGHLTMLEGMMKSPSKPDEVVPRTDTQGSGEFGTKASVSDNPADGLVREGNARLALDPPEPDGRNSRQVEYEVAPKIRCR